VKVSIHDREVFQNLNPVEIASYLRSTGWREVVSKPNHSSIWRKDFEGEDFKMLLPLNRAIGDFTLRMADVVGDLAAVERRSQLEILADLQTAGADVMRVRLRSPDSADGTVPIEQGVPLVDCTREMLLAGACAAIEPRAHFATRKPPKANQFMGNLRLGQSERGSYVLTVLSRVPPHLTPGNGMLFEIQEPFARRAVWILSQALRALREAADVALSSGRFEPFKEAVRAGVSSNLCSALARMSKAVPATSELALSWTWARSRPVDADAIRDVVFPGDRLPVIEEAGRLLNAAAPREGVEIRGIVKKLQRQGEQGPPAGPVTIWAFLDGNPRRVSVTLAEADHHTAILAYERDATVVCTGDLVKSGQQYSLQNPRGFNIVSEE
jgi:hypothetical protein